MYWRRRKTKPNSQMYDTPPYETQIIGVDFDTEEGQRQLQQANLQLTLQAQYPGRPQRLPDNVISLI
jgi:hypothetical protein